MTTEADMVLAEPCTLEYTAVAALVGGQVIQLPDGRAGIVLRDTAAGRIASVAVEGVFSIPKTSGVVILDGGKVFWDYSANAAYFRTVNDRDFFVGAAYGDAASTDTAMLINLNQQPVYLIEMNRDAALVVPTGTQAAGGFGYPKVLGGGRMLELTATSEAQCIDIFSVDRFAVAAKAIFEAIIRVPTNGSGAAVDFNIGLANGTSTTDADAITEHCFFHIDGGSTAINAQSKDGTTTVAATDTTKTITAGSAVANRNELWIDARDNTNVKLYVDGVRVLSGTTFSLSGATGPLGILAHLEKTTGTATGQYVVDAMRLRLMGE